MSRIVRSTDVCQSRCRRPVADQTRRERASPGESCTTQETNLPYPSRSGEGLPVCLTSSRFEG